ncbi:MAG: S8 family serine peptidase, partial [Acidobacteriota bacterium]
MAQQKDRTPDKVAADLRSRIRFTRSGSEEVPVIIQLNGPPQLGLRALLQRSGIRVRGNFDKFNMISLDLPARVVDELASFPEVSVVDNDSKVRVLGHVTTTTGAEQVRGALGGTSVLDGTGVGIAIIDSGIYSDHRSFSRGTDGDRIVFSKDFTGEGRTDDPYGHGSHVASAASGNYSLYGGDYAGIASGANLINLRVLRADGTGSKSAVLDALNWIAANASTYNIRVVNISLGTPSITSYSQDTLCQAVRNLVNSGIVVVAAAGNSGKDANGVKQYGMIHSPGNEPSAITVGATNTFGTNSRSDDGIASYSSRGPTRSYWTDTTGIKHFDNLIKPDLVAPGNKLVYAESSVQGIQNGLVTANPQLDASVSYGAAPNAKV